MLRHSSISFTLTLLLGLFLPAAAYAEDIWKVGAILCLTTECANQGVAARRGAEFAIDDLNAKGGILGKKLKLFVQDSAEGVSGTAAVTAYRQLRTAEGVQFFIGPNWTAAGLALAPIASREDVIVGGFLGAEEFHRTADNLFNFSGISEQFTRISARYAYESGIRRAAVFGSQQPWDFAQSEAFVDEFKKLGGEVVVREDPIPTAGDVRTEVLRVLKTKPDGVFLATMLLMGKASQSLSKLGYRGPRFASYIDDLRLKEGGKSLEGAIFFFPENAVSAYEGRYFNKYGEHTPREGASAYDAVTAFAKSVEAANSFAPKEVKQALLKIKFEGAAGPFELDKEGCIKKKAVGWRVENGKIVKLSPLNNTAK